MTALNLRITTCRSVDASCTCSKVFIDGLTTDGRFEPEVAAKIVEALKAADKTRHQQPEQPRHRLASDGLPLCDTKENPLSYAAFDLKVTCRGCLIIEALQARVEQLVKDAPPAAQVERWRKLEEDEKTRTWELREAYRAAKMVDDACWGEFCVCCAGLLSLDSQDEECGPMHTATQLTHEWVERNKALGVAVGS